MLTVFNFEFLNAVRKKAFIISMAIMFLFTILFSFVPKLVAKFSSGDNKPIGVYSDLSYIDEAALADSYESEFVKYDDPDKMEADLKKNDLDAAILIKGDQRKLIMKSSSMGAMNKYENLAQIATNIEKQKELSDMGVDSAITDKFLESNYYEPVSLEADGAKNFWLVYIALFVLYFLIMMFSNQVAMSIAREKSDRTMELLITAAKPSDLICGKVAAYGLVGVISLLVLYGGMIIGTKFGGETAMDIVESLNLTQLIKVDQIIVTFVFFILGYVLYLFMMAAAASLVSKIEDVNTAIQPLTMIFVISFFVSYFGMMNPGIVLKVASFVPFSSPFAMIARYGVETVPVIEVIISAAILFVSTVLIAKFSIKVYKLGSFNYGTKVNFFKSLFKAIKD